MVRNQSWSLTNSVRMQIEKSRKTTQEIKESMPLGLHVLDVTNDGQMTSNGTIISTEDGLLVLQNRPKAGAILPNKCSDATIKVTSALFP